MPTRARTACGAGGCRALAEPGRFYCADHRADADAARQAADRDRGSAHARGYDRTWKQLRALKLKRDPLCEDHLLAGETVAAGEVDHVKPHKGDTALRLAWGNLRSLCKACHSRKTALRDGGFGRRPMVCDAAPVADPTFTIL